MCSTSDPIPPIHQIIRHDVPIETWFGVGGGADMLATPRTIEELRDLLVMFAHEPVRVLGEGANLLIDDRGIDGLVVSLKQMNWVEESAAPHPREQVPAGTVLVRAGAGADLMRLITESVRLGLAGLEGLAGIPATVGGAAVMNAGGAFGQFADHVVMVRALTRSGEELLIPRAQIDYRYRHSGLNHLIVVEVDLALKRVPESDRPALRERLKEVMAYKKNSQPMGERSAGCVFKNPTIAGKPESAGRLIDMAGCKGMRIGGSVVSDQHANFITARQPCTAHDIIELMNLVRQRVRERFGVELEPEVVVWKRDKPRESGR